MGQLQLLRVLPIRAAHADPGPELCPSQRTSKSPEMTHGIIIFTHPVLKPGLATLPAPAPWH